MEYYSLEEFLMDDLFNRWVKDPDAETIAYWTKWIADHPDKEGMINEAKEILLALGDGGKQLSEHDKQKIWEAIANRRSAYMEILKENDERKGSIKKVWSLYLFKIAAAVAILVTMGGALYYLLRPPRIVMYATGYGEVKEITLPDSSKVFLNANSKLSFNKNWKKDAPREVKLQGEAYFEIVKKSGGTQRRFIVHAGQLQIEDLSTQFDVNNRRKKVKVFLREGKVRLIEHGTKERDSLMMVPGDLVIYDSATSAFVRQKVRQEQFISWKDGIHAFSDASLSEVAHTLEDTWGWRFLFTSDSLKNLRFTGRYEGNDIDSFLLILSKSFNIKITRQDNQIIIRKK